MASLKYLSGFHNEHHSEAVPGSIPVGRNSPQVVAHGLYAEQLNGTAFTMPRKENYRAWLYRILPSVKHGSFEITPSKNWKSNIDPAVPTTPMQLRWDPIQPHSGKKDFIDSITTYAVNGSVEGRSGNAIHLYYANKSMGNRYFYNSDGDFLIVPQLGGLSIRTEMGTIELAPTEICVIPRGIKFQVNLVSEAASGYICENFGAPFELPNLGPIGSNGLAAARDFLYPTASFEDKKGDFKLLTRFCGNLWEASIDHSPLDVVGWHGNYAPYKYDLKLFNTINTVSFDHPDPSIFTVLTSATTVPGQANIDFVIFPPRWMVATDTFRPPYFHRNVMSEFMGLIHGVYDAKPAGGFEPGGCSLHNCMQAHGPETDAFISASKASLAPHYLDKTLAFMFESCLVYHPTQFAMETKTLQKNYLDCWQGLKSNFKP